MWRGKTATATISIRNLYTLKYVLRDSHCHVRLSFSALDSTGFFSVKPIRKNWNVENKTTQKWTSLTLNQGMELCTFYHLRFSKLACEPVHQYNGIKYRVLSENQTPRKHCNRRLPKRNKQSEKMASIWYWPIHLLEWICLCVVYVLSFWIHNKTKSNFQNCLMISSLCHAREAWTEPCKARSVGPGRERGGRPLHPNQDGRNVYQGNVKKTIHMKSLGIRRRNSQGTHCACWLVSVEMEPIHW